MIYICNGHMCGNQGLPRRRTEMPQLDERLKKGISYNEPKDKCGCCPDGVMVPHVELAVLDRIQGLLEAGDVQAALQAIREAKQGTHP